jgi:hypothetical protein
LDAHDALGKVCGLLTETDEAATKLLRDMLTKYCPVHGQRGSKLNVNFEEIMCDVIRSTADGELRKLVAGICSQAGMTSEEIILLSLRFPQVPNPHHPRAKVLVHERRILSFSDKGSPHVTCAVVTRPDQPSIS